MKDVLLERCRSANISPTDFTICRTFLFLGRAIHYPIAMDGALKLKEVSYVHAEGYPTGETKHGPNALIDENLPVVIIATCDRADPGSVLRYEKKSANIQGFKQQSSRVIAIATEGDEEIRTLADHMIPIPETSELLSPILEIVPLQLFAYYMAVKRGLDVDRPAQSGEIRHPGVIGELRVASSAYGSCRRPSAAGRYCSRRI